MDPAIVDIKISVRSIVEFILCGGDIDQRGGRYDPDAMQEGSRLHKKIQKKQGTGYAAEIPLSAVIPIEQEGVLFRICVEGRADGIIDRREQGTLLLEASGEEAISRYCIDEIKCVYLEVSKIQTMIPIHRYQAMCYAYIFADENAVDSIDIQLTYCNIETENINRLCETYSRAVLSEWFHDLVKRYSRWVSWQYQWKQERDASIKSLEFPFPYRPGQKELVQGVYRTILREKKLFIEAPTGVGKTMSTVFPVVKSMAEGITEKLFYLTAKTITRTVAENAFSILNDGGLRIKIVTITAKEKLCPLEKMECNPVSCERARGHYDRVNDAVYDMLVHEEGMSRDVQALYAGKHCVCPYEMCLDLAIWSDAVICDYNYVFDPSVYLRRFFSSDKKNDFVFLIDEAHNLVDRAREMYSAAVLKSSFLSAKKIVKGKAAGVTKQLEACNQVLLRMKRECDECEIWESVSDFVQQLIRLAAELEEFFQMNIPVEGHEELFQLYMDVKYFIFINELLDDNYLIYSDYDEAGDFRLKLMCMDPSKNLLNCLNKGRSAVFFSATLLPVQYYKEQLGGNEGDYAVYAPSPFTAEKRLILLGKDVSTKYSRRSKEEYEKIISYIETFVKAKTGNYLVFFPSYQMMKEIAEAAGGRIPGLVLQSANMTEQEREAFLSAFESGREVARTAFAVMGGIFSEGIDLKEDRLIGAVIVGTGLPMVCNERELFRGFYDLRNNQGFSYAYLYPGMNKVLQSAGRVIRTQEDVGAVLLLDQRFLQPQYQELFPREWNPYEVVVYHTMEEKLKTFWEGHQKNT